MYIGVTNYQYTEDLLYLANCILPAGKKSVQNELCKITTPLRLAHWESMLSSHPDREYADYIISGIRDGFRVGYSHVVSATKPLSSARKNMHSAEENPHVVEEYLEAELARGVLLGPFQREEVPGVHLNRFGVIPKSSQPEKWRLIVDLSHPEGKSVNDGIDPSRCSLQYVRIDEVVKQLLQLGPGALMAKLDVKSAYRIVPVHPEDRFLLGMQWKGRIYVDAALPFGLRSAPKIFTALADALEWMVQQHGAQYIWHYLDDFLTGGAAGSQECRLNLQLVIDICSYLGIPLAEEKVEGPAACLVFLGIVIDTVKGELRLPAQKLERLRSQLEEWLGRRRCTKRELLSIAGQLQHAAKVVRPGRVFLRRLFDLSTTVKKPHHHLNLSSGARSDLAWWREFIEQWNGVSLMSVAGDQSPEVTLTSDASGTWGCGAYWKEGWFQLEWRNTTCPAHQNIAIKEMIPIVVASAIWGRRWSGKVVCCRCDNSAVVAVLNHRSSRDGDLMHLLRCLTFFEAAFSMRLTAVHIAGADNVLADDLSRDKLSSFLQAVGNQAATKQSIPPQSLLDMVINQRPDWTSPSWRVMFRSILNSV